MDSLRRERRFPSNNYDGPVYIDVESELSNIKKRLINLYPTLLYQQTVGTPELKLDSDFHSDLKRFTELTQILDNKFVQARDFANSRRDQIMKSLSAIRDETSAAIHKRDPAILRNIVSLTQELLKLPPSIHHSRFAFLPVTRKKN